MYRVPRTICLVAFAAAMLLTTSLGAEPFQIVRYRDTTYPTCTPTIYTAGDRSDDLKVHIVGSRYDTIEAYFKSGNYKRVTLPAGTNLLSGTNVFLAPANEFGTFAVRCGSNFDTLRIYGWKKDLEQPEEKEVTLEAGFPIRACWVTSQILKVHYGPNQSKEFVIRFNGSNTPWKVLYPNP